MVIAIIAYSKVLSGNIVYRAEKNNVTFSDP
jgi:hypothetical protein